jgi:4a-hydroxytetrahydrobiopterin dehydratase
MAEGLAAKTCTPCQGGIPPMPADRAAEMMSEAPGWELKDAGARIERDFKFKDFAEAFDFVRKVADLSDEEFHHPDVEFGWGYCTVSLQTKKIRGLHENDFIMAAKINAFAPQ